MTKPSKDRKSNGAHFKIQPVSPKLYAAQAVVLMALWLLLSGHYDAFHIGMGVFSVAAILLMNRRLSTVRLGSASLPDWSPMYLGRTVLYVIWLFFEILKAGWAVAKVVLHPKMPIEPHIIRVRSRFSTGGAKLIFGNSVTVTPGTVTVMVEGDDFIIHSLIPEAHGGVEDGSLQNRVNRLFRTAPEKVEVELFRKET